MRISAGLLGLLTAVATFSHAAASCGPETLGTSRTMEVDASHFREIQGHEKSFGLRRGEVVLTFDDGPIAGKTPRILKTLKDECVKATFFYVGRMAKAYPRLVRRVVAEGHTLAHHTHAHNRLPNYRRESASHHIDQGIRSLQKIAYASDDTTAQVPFFRYPYLARNSSTDRLLAARGLIAFGANIDSLDWKDDTPGQVHDRIMRILKREGKGIILMHDIQNRTATMLPRLLRSLKDGGYKVVHIVPKGGARPPVEINTDPVVVAALDTGLGSQSENDTGIPAFPTSEDTANLKPRVARLAAEAERDVAKMLSASGYSHNRASQPPVNIVAKPEVVKTSETVARARAAQLNRNAEGRAGSGETRTTGATTGAAPKTRIRLKPEAPERTRQKPDLVQTAGLTPETDADEQTTLRGQKTNKLKSKGRAKPLKVIAGETRKRSPSASKKTTRLARSVVGSGNWKLRRSQWIIN